MKVIRWLKKEIIHLLPAILYFAICFNLLHFAQILMMQPQDIQFTSYMGATLGAIIAAKVILIAEYLPFINAFPNKPLLYNISWKFFIYSFFVLLVQITDYIAQKFYHTDSWALAYSTLKADVSQSRFWGIQINILMIFLFYIIFTDLVRVIGDSKIKNIFFGKK
ncbi:MAG: hypothetical protein P4M12_10210 [Gammaproteobacteria bacterium]|nr:hypothetical protein [Gammaproteobacteria bacterium]